MPRATVYREKRKGPLRNTHLSDRLRKKESTKEPEELKGDKREVRKVWNYEILERVTCKRERPENLSKKISSQKMTPRVLPVSLAWVGSWGGEAVIR